MTSTLLDSCCNEQPPARMVAGALAHLARHMETGCARAGRLAAMLLDQVANDPEADVHLRAHALELVDILERDSLPGHGPAPALPANGFFAVGNHARKADVRP